MQRCPRTRCGKVARAKLGSEPLDVWASWNVEEVRCVTETYDWRRTIKTAHPKPGSFWQVVTGNAAVVKLRAAVLSCASANSCPLNGAVNSRLVSELLSECRQSAAQQTLIKCRHKNCELMKRSNRNRRAENSYAGRVIMVAILGRLCSRGCQTSIHVLPMTATI